MHGNGVQRHQVLSDGTRGSSERAWSAICGEIVGICDSLLFTVKLEVLIHAKTTVHTGRLHAKPYYDANRSS